MRSAGRLVVDPRIHAGEIARFTSHVVYCLGLQYLDLGDRRRRLRPELSETVYTPPLSDRCRMRNLGKRSSSFAPRSAAARELDGGWLLPGKRDRWSWR